LSVRSAQVESSGLDSFPCFLTQTPQFSILTFRRRFILDGQNRTKKRNASLREFSSFAFEFCFETSRLLWQIFVSPFRRNSVVFSSRAGKNNVSSLAVSFAFLPSRQNSLQ
jgi:hypothetical protein